MLVTIIVTGTYPSPDGTTVPQGTVSFRLPFVLVDPTDQQNVSNLTDVATIANGLIAQPLVANDSPGIGTTSSYWVSEQVVGAPLDEYWVTVPAAPPSSRTVTDGVAVTSSAVLHSATAAFTSDDLGQFVFCPAFPLGSVIDAIIDGENVTMSDVATQTASGLYVVVGASVDISTLRPS